MVPNHVWTKNALFFFLERSRPVVLLNVTLKTVFYRQNALQSVPHKLCFITGIVLPFCPSSDHLHYSETMLRAATGPIFEGHVISNVVQGKSEWTGKNVPWTEEGQGVGDYVDASGEHYRTCDQKYASVLICSFWWYCSNSPHFL